MIECNQNRVKCNFRNTGGSCTAEAGQCTSIVEQCLTAGAKLKEGGSLPCSRIKDSLCSVYLYPARKWATACPLRTMDSTPVEERKINPLKASKKAARR